MKKIIIVAAGALVLAGTGTALASIPDSGGVIHGCYAAKDGALSVIDTDAGQSCVKGQTPLDWNQAGPAGPQGPAGAAGPAGPQGPAGVSGYQIERCDLNFPDGTDNAGVVNATNPLCALTSNVGYPVATLSCPSGKKAISVSYKLSQDNFNDAQSTPLLGAEPATDGTDYVFTYAYASPPSPDGFNPAAGMTPTAVYVTCAAVSP